MENILNIPETHTLDNEAAKRVFTLRRPKDNGLLLTIKYKTTKKYVRITHCDYHSFDNVLALANNEGFVFIIDLLSEKYWPLPKFESCTCIKLSKYNQYELLVGKLNGALDVVDTNSGRTVAHLISHKFPVVTVSFADANICVSMSKQEAVIWSLDSYGKIQVLTLGNNCSLKLVHFIPVSNHILACFQDDVIQIWEYNTFKNLKQFLPSNWNNHSIKSVTFSRNGRIMIVSGFLPVLAIFILSNWKLLKTVKLPMYIKTVKKVQFIAHDFDGGFNKILSVLSGNGTIYFYNIEKDSIIWEIKSKCEITNFTISISNSQYFACLLSSGEAEIYTLANFITDKFIQQTDQVKPKLKIRSFPNREINQIKCEIDDTLQLDKIKAILREYDEFPEIYRAVIWEKVLKLPNNKQIYNSIINHVTTAAFRDLYLKFPLEDIGLIKCLKHTLNNIVTWSPFFANIDFLPVFLFPFVKVIHKRPIACFELCCTIIMNWCQYWFEYYPLLPMNILAIIDNLFMEHDPDLLHHFCVTKLPSRIYSWPLLETAFSEVLTTTQWLKFWDHVLLNEPGYLLCAVVSYNILQKKMLLLLNSEDSKNFCHSQKPIDIKKFISCTYHIFTNTSEKNHPRQYLKNYTALNSSSYPSFVAYPKLLVDFQTENRKLLNDQLDELHKEHNNVHKQLTSNHVPDFEKREEENRRLQDMEKACLQNIKSFQDHIKFQQEKLVEMRKKLFAQEQEILNDNLKKIEEWKKSQQVGDLEILTDKLQINDSFNEMQLANMESSILKKNNKLLKSKFTKEVESTVADGLSPEIANRFVSFQGDVINLRKTLGKIKNDIQEIPSGDIDLISGISATNQLIHDIKKELTNTSNPNNQDLKVKCLEKQATTLQKQISHLLKSLSQYDKVNNDYGKESDRSNSSIS